MNGNSKHRVVFFGTPDFVLPIAKTLASQFELVGVVTSPDAPVGRKKVMTPSPIKKWYMEYLLSENKEGVILTPETLTEDVAIKLRKLHTDVFVTAAYGKLIPKKFLKMPTYGALNVHPSLLPRYRGPSPIQSAILDGKDTLGITIMKMDEKLDHGPIVKQWEIPIAPLDTFASLHTKAFSSAAEKLPEIIKDYEAGTIIPTPQNQEQATFCDKVTKQDGYFDIINPPEPDKLDRMIRAYYPWPTAHTKLKMKNGELKIIKFLPEKRIQIEGRNPIQLKDFINGYPELKETIQKLGIYSSSEERTKRSE